MILYKEEYAAEFQKLLGLKDVVSFDVKIERILF